MRVAAFDAANAARRAVALARTEKRCSGTCRAVLPISAFGRNRSRSDGLDTECRDCHNAKNAELSRARWARLPVEPLVAQVTLRGGAVAVWGRHSWQYRAFQRAVADGGIRSRIADALACDLGLHPALLWPSWFPVAS